MEKLILFEKKYPQDPRAPEVLLTIASLYQSQSNHKEAVQTFKRLIEKYPQSKIFIITSDKDYLQLNSHNVHIFNLAFKNIAENKSSTGDAKKDLEIKIIMGDTSDNIPSVFPKCGPKTAQKCIEDPEFFKKKMAGNPDYFKQYELNKKIVDFNNIPEDLVNEFLKTIE